MKQKLNLPFKGKTSRLFKCNLQVMSKSKAFIRTYVEAWDALGGGSSNPLSPLVVAQGGNEWNRHTWLVIISSSLRLSYSQGTRNQSTWLFNKAPDMRMTQSIKHLNPIYLEYKDMLHHPGWEQLFKYKEDIKKVFAPLMSSANKCDP